MTGTHRAMVSMLKSQNCSSSGDRLTCSCEYLLPRLFPSHCTEDVDK